MPFAFIFDIVEPLLDGCRCVRDDDPDAAILFLTGRSDLDARVSGLNVSADDYLTKPFEPRSWSPA
jgi:DNA-binding response OmpR family regulator